MVGFRDEKPYRCLLKTQLFPHRLFLDLNTVENVDSSWHLAVTSEVGHLFDAPFFNLDHLAFITPDPHFSPELFRPKTALLLRAISYACLINEVASRRSYSSGILLVRSGRVSRQPKCPRNDTLLERSETCLVRWTANCILSSQSP